ncbi:hypothetical protein IWQ62_002139, partial [Dispira parvispora]
MRTISLVERLKWEIRESVNPRAIAIGDVTNDKHNELAVGTTLGKLLIFRGQGHTYAPPGAAQQPELIVPEATPWATYPRLGIVTAIAIGDVRAQGKNSVVCLNSGGELYIFDYPWKAQSTKSGGSEETKLSNITCGDLWSAGEISIQRADHDAVLGEYSHRQPTTRIPSLETMDTRKLHRPPHTSATQNTVLDDSNQKELPDSTSVPEEPTGAFLLDPLGSPRALGSTLASSVETTSGPPITQPEATTSRSVKGDDNFMHWFRQKGIGRRGLQPARSPRTPLSPISESSVPPAAVGSLVTEITHDSPVPRPDQTDANDASVLEAEHRIRQYSSKFSVTFNIDQILIADFDQDGINEILLAGTDGFLYAYCLFSEDESDPLAYQSPPPGESGSSTRLDRQRTRSSLLFEARAGTSVTPITTGTNSPAQPTPVPTGQSNAPSYYRNQPDAYLAPPAGSVGGSTDPHFPYTLGSSARRASVSNKLSLTRALVDHRASVYLTTGGVSPKPIPELSDNPRAHSDHKPQKATNTSHANTRLPKPDGISRPEPASQPARVKRGSSEKLQEFDQQQLNLLSAAITSRMSMQRTGGISSSPSASLHRKVSNRSVAAGKRPLGVSETRQMDSAEQMAGSLHPSGEGFKGPPHLVNRQVSGSGSGSGSGKYTSSSSYELFPAVSKATLEVSRHGYKVIQQSKPNNGCQASDRLCLKRKWFFEQTISSLSFLPHHPELKESLLIVCQPGGTSTFINKQGHRLFTINFPTALPTFVSQPSSTNPSFSASPVDTSSFNSPVVRERPAHPRYPGRRSAFSSPNHSPLRHAYSPVQPIPELHLEPLTPSPGLPMESIRASPRFQSTGASETKRSEIPGRSFPANRSNHSSPSTAQRSTSTGGKGGGANADPTQQTLGVTPKVRTLSPNITPRDLPSTSLVSQGLGAVASSEIVAGVLGLSKLNTAIAVARMDGLVYFIDPELFDFSGVPGYVPFLHPPSWPLLSDFVLSRLTPSLSYSESPHLTQDPNFSYQSLAGGLRLRRRDTNAPFGTHAYSSINQTPNSQPSPAQREGQGIGLGDQVTVPQRRLTGVDAETGREVPWNGGPNTPSEGTGLGIASRTGLTTDSGPKGSGQPLPHLAAMPASQSYVGGEAPFNVFPVPGADSLGHSFSPGTQLTPLHSAAGLPPQLEPTTTAKNLVSLYPRASLNEQLAAGEQLFTVHVVDLPYDAMHVSLDPLVPRWEADDQRHTRSRWHLGPEASVATIPSTKASPSQRTALDGAGVTWETVGGCNTGSRYPVQPPHQSSSPLGGQIVIPNNFSYMQKHPEPIDGIKMPTLHRKSSTSSQVLRDLTTTLQRYDLTHPVLTSGRSTEYLPRKSPGHSYTPAMEHLDLVDRMFSHLEGSVSESPVTTLAAVLPRDSSRPDSANQSLRENWSLTSLPPQRSRTYSNLQVSRRGSNTSLSLLMGRRPVSPSIASASLVDAPGLVVAGRATVATPVATSVVAAGLTSRTSSGNFSQTQPSLNDPPPMFPMYRSADQSPARPDTRRDAAFGVQAPPTMGLGRPSGSDCNFPPMMSTHSTPLLDTGSSLTTPGALSRPVSQLTIDPIHSVVPPKLHSHHTWSSGYTRRKTRALTSASQCPPMVAGSRSDKPTAPSLSADPDNMLQNSPATATGVFSSSAFNSPRLQPGTAIPSASVTGLDSLLTPSRLNSHIKSASFVSDASGEQRIPNGLSLATTMLPGGGRLLSAPERPNRRDGHDL